ncbi:uncharacterized protein BDR25DRAFT_332525 [Lindgomyces ingoldianus]|uniref:Uncharacterized protein n=1 Tax=Lindgomyces ingoldianus TaxID=673940 RepID=A0ACB6R312_9PLEO|nr:uncharacterized protein BDR25DRAFT_332525 [Lindgomyces ingoldianus]KAF2473673.1 hypothetical protein BDR25DRAFT_332525 [Lindgomyces ingoldianus]
MKISSTCLVLLTARVYGVTATVVPNTASVNPSGGGRILTPQNNYNGWVNPEDLAPMPQCIAQQDQSTWLSAMTKCTGKLCTSHFGFICTHHQWLTQLSCLSTGFSSDVIKGYFPYCGRSVLAKAQLYQWIRNVTGRTWLVDVGDTNGLENLSPASLTEGYAAVSVIHKAPTCLTSSISALSMERFQHVMASCSFTSTTQHTGNAARPWEYNESLLSMTALGFETVGYNLTRRSIGYGEYFDKGCFCSTFTMDPKQDPCSGPEQIDSTRERLWMNATCGPKSLPKNWTDKLKTTEFAYIPTEDWHWPMCVTDMPKQVTELTDQCATDACELDSSGYCKVLKRSVDRDCFCRNISYDSCGGSCQIFETRIDFVKWLHDLCGSMRDWHGLPDNWRQLAAPTPLDMIPWRWTIKPSNESNTPPIIRLGSIKATEKCPSNRWKLGTFALVNMATFLAAFLSQRTGIRRIVRGFLWQPHQWCWFSRGILIAVLQLLANWFNAFLVQKTLGYEDVPVIQLMLLWCSMPRLAWLATLLIGLQPFEAIDFSTAASSFFVEMILQGFSSYYMIITVNYGREHNFYLGGLESAERGRSAKIMYAGALLWLITISVAFVRFLQATRKMNRVTGSGSFDLLKRQRSKQTISNIAEKVMAQLNEHFSWLGEKNWVHYWEDKSRDSEETFLISSERGNYTVYGTLPVQSQNSRVSRKAFANLYAVTTISMPLLWVAQWLFWGGFVGLSSEEFCPPKLGVLAAVWIAFSLGGATFGATL